MRNQLILPQVVVSYSKLKSTSEAVLIAGGRKPSADWFHEIRMNRRIICIDHGVDFCKEVDVVPDMLIGDLDSATDESISWAMDKGINIERHPVDKDFTDTQLALKHVDSDTFAIITGAFGGRLDHLYSTLFTCGNSPIKSCLTDEHETVLFVGDGESISVDFKVKPFAISLLPITEICRGVTLDGVYWSLNNANLNQSVPNAISNRINDFVDNCVGDSVDCKTAHCSIKEGRLAIYLCFDNCE